MKLELKHLAPYLPYGLKIDSNGFEELRIMDADIDNTCKIVNIGACVRMQYKPILRPLSDLSKKHLDVLYFEIIGTDDDMYGSRDSFEDDLDVWTCDFNHSPMLVYGYLIKNHFDVFGLIHKGLAIDVNTL